MGNRANVIFIGSEGEISPCVYLHWNGGPESIYAFIHEMNRRRYRKDAWYECARFIGMLAEFTDTNNCVTTSIGVVNGPSKVTGANLDKIMTDSSDNGFYIVNRNTGIVQRFKTDYTVNKLKEMPKDAVDAEKRIALKTKYYLEIVKYFERNSKPVE